MILLPLQLIIVVLIAQTIKFLQSSEAFISWESSVGPFFSKKLSFWLQGTDLEKGIDLFNYRKEFVFFFLISSLIIFIFKLIFSFIQYTQAELFIKNFREKIFSHYLSLPYKQSMEVLPGTLSLWFTEYSKSIKDSILQIVGDRIIELFTIVVFLCWLMFLDMSLCILFLLVLLPSFIVLRSMGKKVKKLSRDGMQCQEDIVNVFLEKVKGWETIKAFRTLDFEMEHFEKTNHRFYQTWLRSLRSKTLASPVLEWLTIVGVAILLLVALRRQNLTGDSGLIVTQFVLSLVYLINAIQIFLNQGIASRRGIEAWRRMEDFLALPIQPLVFPAHWEPVLGDGHMLANQSLNSIRIRGMVMEGLSHKPIDLDLKSGDILAIIGPSGVGKTTFLRCLLGLHGWSAGEIIVNNQHYNHSAFSFLAHRAVFIGQDPYVLPQSVAANVIYSQDFKQQGEEAVFAADPAVERCLKKALLQKKGDDVATSLSQGEKQRLMFARGFYQNCALWVCDEATSALDETNETKIIEALKEHVGSSRMAIMVAHRPKILDDCTQVLDFKDLILNQVSS